MRLASFNVLADAYIGYGDYSHVDPDLTKAGARQEHLVATINSLGADIVGLQEADRVLLERFETDNNWQTLYQQKTNNKPDGCLTLVRHTLEIEDYKPYEYHDTTPHVFQVLRIGQLAIANTHIKWAPKDSHPHIGVTQTQELLSIITGDYPAVILADCNDRPGGPVRKLVQDAGFTNVCGDTPTAIVNQELVALDLLAIRNVQTAEYVPYPANIAAIPNPSCASDHVPIVADITLY